jgi:large subunit ribosomal protein L4e
LVVDDSLESVKRVKEAKEVAAKLGLENDLKRAKAGKKMRSGKSRLRKGGYRVPKSVLVVLGDDKGAGKAFRNLPGVDVCKVSDLSAELLAPGGQAGRLAVFTKSAVDKIGKEGLWA